MKHGPQNQAINIEIFNNQYISGGAQLKCREEDSTQKMLSGIDSANFFNNLEIKKDLVKLVCSYFQIDDCRNLFEFPLIISSGENIWNIAKETIEVLPISNHEKAETKLIFHAGKNNKAAVTVIKKYGRVFTSNLCFT